MSKAIDAHHHLWRYSEAEYDWIGPGMETIARDFLPADLEAERKACGIAASVVVQARQTLRETDWLLELAESSPGIGGVVGWAPVASPEFPGVLERLRQSAKLKGLRHVIQAEPEADFILREDFNAGIRALAGSDLVYDILIYERQLAAAIEFVDRHPDQVFVLDHLAKPRIKDRLLEPWRTNLFELAKRENVYCKLSGMVTEADWKNCDANLLRLYADAALEAFGPRRLMFGSDWPVCLLAATYATWFQMAQNLLAGLSAFEKELVFGGVACKVYSLESVERRASFTKQE